MYLGLVFFTDITCHKTGASLKPWASLFLLLSPLPPPASFNIQELDCSFQVITEVTQVGRIFQPSIPFSLWRYSPPSRPLSPLEEHHPPHSSARLLHPCIPRICDVSLHTTSSHLFLGLPTCLVVLKFPCRNFFFWLGDPLILQSYNITIPRPRLHFLNCLFPFRGTTSWTIVRKENAQKLIRQMGKNI